MIPVNDDFSKNHSPALGPTRKRRTGSLHGCFVRVGPPASKASKKPEMLPSGNVSPHEFITNSTNAAFPLDDQLLKYRMLCFQVALGVPYRKGKEI